MPNEYKNLDKTFGINPEVVEEETKVKGPSTVNNALFVGSTAELGKLLKTGLPKEDK